MNGNPIEIACPLEGGHPESHSNAHSTPDGVVTEETLRAIQDLLFTEARLLDTRHFEQWMQLLTDDFEYWAPIDRHATLPTQSVSLFYDNRDSLSFRIQRLEHPEMHVQMPPSRTMRQVTNIEVLEVGVSELCVRSNFAMFEYRPGWEKQWFAGFYQHVLTRCNGQFRIRRKKAVLIDADAAMPPLAQPF